MSIIDSLKRLERAGAENSRTTEKLRSAAAQVADLICEIVSVGTEAGLGSMYRVVEMTTNVSSQRFLARSEWCEWADGNAVDVYVNGIGGYLHGDLRCYVAKPSRESVLAFARDVADGLLDKFAERLENDAAEASEAIAVLEAASAAAEAASMSIDPVVTLKAFATRVEAARVTDEVRDAARAVANMICNSSAPIDKLADWDYSVREVNGVKCLISEYKDEDEVITVNFNYDATRYGYAPCNDDIISFACDVAAGLLDSIAAASTK